MVFVIFYFMKEELSSNKYTVTEFKAKCLNLLDKTAKQGMEYTITKRGEPIAKVTPIKKAKKTRLGCLKGLAEIHGDIVHFDTSDMWEALKE